MITHHQLFSLVCGQANVWTVGGQQLPLCQRCTGLYVGAACALLAWAMFRPKPTNVVLWVHGSALLLMVPFGYHLVPQNGDVRTLTGFIFAFALVYFLLLLPGANATSNSRGGTPAYLTFAFAAAAGLMFAVRYGTRGTGTVIVWTSVIGLLALALLAVGDVILFLRALGDLRPKWMGRPES